MAKRKRRRHSASQLASRPLTFKTRSGPLVISSVKRNGVHVIDVEYPASAPVWQQPAANQAPEGPCDNLGKSAPDSR